MSVTNIQEAEVALAVGLTLLQAHDQKMQKWITTRVNLELVTSVANGKLNVSDTLNELSVMAQDIDRLGAHVVRNTEFTDMEQYREAVFLAKVKSELVDKLQAEVAKRRAFLDMYQISGTEAVDAEEYSFDHEVNNYTTMTTQLATAQDLFIQAAERIHIGEPSGIIMPERILSLGE